MTILAGKLEKVLFPGTGSQVAFAFACSCTKTTTIMNHALAPSLIGEAVYSACLTSPFTSLCDGGSDNFDKKYFGILVRFWDEEQGAAVTRCLAMPLSISPRERAFSKPLMVG